MFRNRRSTIIQVLVPFILLLLLFAVKFGLEADTFRGEWLVNDPSPKVEGIPGLHECRVGPISTECITLAYTPDDDPVVQEIVDRIVANEGITKTRGFPTQEDFNEYMIENLNSTQAAVHFQVKYKTATHDLANVESISYAVQNNQTDTRFKNRRIQPFYQVTMPYIKAVDKAVLQLTTEAAGSSPALTFDLKYAMFPHPKIAPLDVIGSFGQSFFFGAMMFNIVMQLGILVNERELHLRQSMHQMGLSVSAYWTSYFISNFTFNTSTVFLLIVSGCIFQFDFFLKTEFPVYFFLFWTFALSMVTFVFFVSNFVAKSRTGTILGFAMFLIGSMVQGFVDVIFKDSVEVGYRILFIIQPWALLARGMSYIGIYSSKNFDGMKWSQIADHTDFMPIRDIYLLLVLDTVIFLLLAIYLDHALPDENGMRRHPCFCVMQSYWCPTSERIVGTQEAPSGNKRRRQSRHSDIHNNDDAAIDMSSSPVPEQESEEILSEDDIKKQLELTKAGLDPDVVREAQKVRDTLDVNYPVRISQLGITFYAYKLCCFRDPQRDFQAVREINLLLDRNSLFCLLGHNGAGKSTTINMLTGLLKPTAGDALVNGYSITNSMHEIKKFMGVCPQHDVLWNELTAAEHLEMFAVFKGLDPTIVDSEVSGRLEDVGLTKYGQTNAGNFSGGMRRRLSVAIALIGNPAIVYLDEPTTGMDPVSRRQVWDLIEKVKYDRVTVLTTHSMEEADVLGDRIGIMKEGKFICLGSSVRLKNKFGTGYRVSCMVNSNLPLKERKSQLRKISQFFASNLPEASVDVNEASSIRFKIPRTASQKLVDFFSVLETKKEELNMVDIQLSLTTLEEVFLSVGAIGEDHADERFGVSSQIGTALSKALKRLEDIREIQAHRENAKKGNANSIAELERRHREEEVLDVDNSEESLAVELPMLLEIEAVANAIERVKHGFESNSFVPFAKGSPQQQQHWNNITAAQAHTNIHAIITNTVSAHSQKQQPVVTFHSNGSSTEGVQLAELNKKQEEEDEDAEDIQDLSAEMATQQDEALKNFLKEKLVDARKPCCHDLRRRWKRMSTCQKIYTVGGILFTLLIILMVIGGASRKEDVLVVDVPIFNTVPTYATLSAGLWSQILPGAPTICSRQDPFSYFVYKPEHNENNNLLIHFQDGDTCWDEGTCNQRAPATKFRVTTDITRASFMAQNLTGVFTKSETNPFVNYTHVYIPHCSADRFWGNTSVLYGAGMNLNHRGAVNTKSVLDWLKTEFPNTAMTADSNVVVTGTGSGAYGAAIWLPQIADFYSTGKVMYLGDHAYDPTTPSTYLTEDDSLLELSDFPKTYLANYTDYMDSISSHALNVRSIWGVDEGPAKPTDVTLSNPSTPLTLASLLSAAHTAYPSIKFLFFGSTSTKPFEADNNNYYRTARAAVRTAYADDKFPVPFINTLVDVDGYIINDPSTYVQDNMVTYERAGMVRVTLSKLYCKEHLDKLTTLATTITTNYGTLLSTQNSLTSLMESPYFYDASLTATVATVSTAVSPASWLSNVLVNDEIAPQTHSIVCPV